MEKIRQSRVKTKEIVLASETENETQAVRNQNACSKQTKYTGVCLVLTKSA